MELSGKVALVTGGAVRVGRALCLGLAGEGMRLVVHYHSSAAEAEDLVAALRDAGGEAVALRADLAHMAELDRFAADAEAAFGRVDVLVNSASVFPEASLDEVDEALWDHTLAVNLKAPFFLIQRLARGMRERGEGVVVNIGDLAGLQAWRGYTAHAVAKAGLIHLTRVAARTLAPEVRVVGVAPGTVLPPDEMPEATVRHLVELTPLRAVGSPDDVVEAVLYLLRASFVTGHILAVDGGRLLR